MAGEWPQQALEEVAELSGGFAFKSEDYSADGRFVLRTLNIKDDGSIHRDDAVFLPLEKCDLYKRFELQEHDTLFVMVGATLGKVGYVRRETLPALLNQNMWRIRGRDGLCDKRYLQYAFRHTVVKNLGWASGSARDFVRRDDYRTMGIPVPPLAEQKAIAAVLGALDDKIELNRRMNATLEAMARALFQSWFVDFDPVRAKLDGRAPFPLPVGEGQGEGASGLPAALDPATAALFPDSFQDSELGEIPHGWRLGTLGELVELRTDRVDATPAKDHMRYIALEDMPSKSIDLSSFQLGLAVNSSIISFRKGDVLFGSMRPYFHKVGLAIFDGITRTTTFVLRPRKNCFRHFSLLHFFSDDVVAHSTTASVGTTIPYVRWDSMESYRIPIPPDSLLEAFEKTVSPLVQRIAAQGEESRTLATLRDTLLPKLLSGELSVTETH